MPGRPEIVALILFVLATLLAATQHVFIVVLFMAFQATIYVDLAKSAGTPVSPDRQTASGRQ